jgi:hypothetical protein
VSKVLVVYDSSRNLVENVTGGGFFLFIGLLVYKFIGLVVYWFIGDLLSSCKVDGLEANNIRWRYGKPSRDFSHKGTKARRKMLAHFTALVRGHETHRRFIGLVVYWFSSLLVHW